MKHVLRLPFVLVALVLALPVAVGTQAPARKKLLFLTHAALYKHTSLAPAEKSVTEWGKNGGFDVTTVEGYKQDSDKIDLSFLTPEYLAQYHGLMLRTNGNLPLMASKKSIVGNDVKGGKALIGPHCATLPLSASPEFGEILGGYSRRSLVPMNLMAQGRIGLLKVEDQNPPATKM